MDLQCPFMWNFSRPANCFSHIFINHALQQSVYLTSSVWSIFINVGLHTLFSEQQKKTLQSANPDFNVVFMFTATCIPRTRHILPSLRLPPINLHYHGFSTISNSTIEPEFHQKKGYPHPVLLQEDSDHECFPSLRYIGLRRVPNTDHLQNWNPMTEIWQPSDSMIRHCWVSDNPRKTFVMPFYSLS